MPSEQKWTGTDEDGRRGNVFLSPPPLHRARDLARARHREGLETRPRFRLVGSNIGWWYVPRRCWQYERRPMKVTVRLPSTFVGLAARTSDRPSQSYAYRSGERCSRLVSQVPIAPRRPSVSLYRYKVASATAIAFRRCGPVHLKRMYLTRDVHKLRISWLKIATKSLGD